MHEFASHPGSQAFWRKVVGRHTGGRYTEYELRNEDGTNLGPIQTFDSSS